MLSNGEQIATEEEIKTYEKVQYLLTMTQKMSSDDLAGAIVSILPLNTDLTVSFLVNELVDAYIDIHQNKQVILETIIAFCDNYPVFKQILTTVLGQPISDTRIKIFHFRILRYLLANEVYNIHEINKIIANYPPLLENQYALLIMFFAKELERENGENFQKAFEIVEGFQNLTPAYRRIFDQYVGAPMHASKFGTDKKWDPTIKYVETGLDDLDIVKIVLEQNEKAINGRLEVEPELKANPAYLYPDPHFLAKPPVFLLAAYTGWRQLLSKHLYDASRQKDFNGKGLREYALAGGDVGILEFVRSMDAFRLKGEPTHDPEENERKWQPVEYYPPIIKRDLGPVGLHAAAPSTVKKDPRPRTNLYVLDVPAIYRRMEALKWCSDNLELIPLDYNLALIAAASVNFLAGMDYLLKRGASVNGTDVTGRTALHAAAENGALEAMKMLLIQPGIQVNARDNKLQTPLHAAAYAKDKRSFEFLSNVAGIDKNAMDIYRNTPFDVLEESEKDIQ